MNEFLFTPWEPGTERPLPPIEAVGGKGYGLYWLASRGFPTPPTWVLSTAAFDLVVRRMELQDLIAGLEKAIRSIGDDWHHTERLLEEIEPRRSTLANQLAQGILPDLVGRALEKLVLMPTQWAVRSSATVEDRPGQSFAGQFLSLLSVPGGRSLWEAIRTVWSSNFRREVLAYCAQRKVPLPRMAVILQPMEPITAQDRSGVAFSHSPVSTMPGVLIQASYGAGETVVGGYGGDLYSVDKEDLYTRRMSPPQIRITGPQGYLISANSPADPPLTEEEARYLASLILRVAEAWGGPVNVEFVWRAGQEPQLVQVRSAT
jgi:pyruvate,water dikinase